MPAPGDPVAEVVAARLADTNFALVRRLPRKERAQTALNAPSA
jgi:hypothetical protein